MKSQELESFGLLAGGKILVMDNKEILCDFISRILTKSGYDVESYGGIRVHKVLLPNRICWKN